MSPRYTGAATMDEPALRDVERWKDKIEVRLDNRQVFFLFFGSAMVACMLFVLGVIVGKRLESRGRAVAPVVEDPLAALDRFGVDGAAAPAPSALTFPRALLAGGAPAKTEHAERALAKPTLTNVVAAPSFVAPPAPTGPSPKKLSALPRPLAGMTGVGVASAAAKGSPASSPKMVASAAVAPAATPSPATPKMAATPPKLVAASATPPSVRASAPAGAAKAAAKAASATAPASTKPVPSGPGTKSPIAAAPKIAPASAAKIAPASAAAARKAAFLLQLSSFQDRSEADAYARRFASQSAYVVSSEVPGKGTMYRVRVGNYANLKEATAAKTAFEHDHGVIAYVAGNGPSQ